MLTRYACTAAELSCVIGNIFAALFLRVGTVGVNAEDSESLFDGAFHFGGENALPIKSRHWHIQDRKSVV